MCVWGGGGVESGVAGSKNDYVFSHVSVKIFDDRHFCIRLLFMTF